MILGQLRRDIVQMLSASQVEDAASVAKYLICDVMDMSTTEMLMRDRDEVQELLAGQIMDKAQRLADGEPLQYVTGKAYFHGYEFHVAPGALIPRPETEELVDMVLKVGRGKRVLDIGTGSGCIAISLKLLDRSLDVSSVDVSEEALSIARGNDALLKAGVTFFKGDILDRKADLGQYDIVVSNPPYICNREKVDMKANVLEHEPHLALFVPDDDPLLFYRTIAERCCNGMLSDGGQLFFEINEAYKDETCLMLTSLGYTDVEAHKDMYGKWRMVYAKRSLKASSSL